MYPLSLKKEKGCFWSMPNSCWMGWWHLTHLTEKDGMIDLSMADVANGGIVAGAGLSGRRLCYSLSRI